jgi:transposase
MPLERGHLGTWIMWPGRGVLAGTWKYSAEFRADAVELGRSAGRPIAQVAKEAGINHETLRHWVRSAERAERPEAAAEALRPPS